MNPYIYNSNHNLDFQQNLTHHNRINSDQLVTKSVYNIDNNDAMYSSTNRQSNYIPLTNGII